MTARDDLLAALPELERWPVFDQNGVWRIHAPALLAAVRELQMVESIIARRPALDLPTLWQNVEKAITVAKEADALRAENERLRKVADAAKLHRGIRAWAPICPYVTCRYDAGGLRDDKGALICSGCKLRDEARTALDAALAELDEGGGK